MHGSAERACIVLGVSLHYADRFSRCVISLALMRGYIIRWVCPRTRVSESPAAEDEPLERHYEPSNLNPGIADVTILDLQEE